MTGAAAKAVAIAGVLAAALLPLPAAAELHAIVAGFNDYAGNAKLRGAVADAEDIAAVLQRRGVRDLVKLTDGSTTVAVFRSRFADMVARAKAGDMILFAFSGHGMRSPETRVPRRTPDGFDKGFVFPTFDQVRHPDELLRDEDLYDLFQATASKGLRVLFVVDACHAGSGLRGVDPRHGGGAYKFQQFDLGSAAPMAPPRNPPPPRPLIPGVAAITAQIAEKTVQEMDIDGRMRGVLSYAVARGLEGGADPDRTGTVTIGRLYEYIRPIVRDKSENQVPVFTAREADGALPILTMEKNIALPQPKVEPGLPEPSDIGVFAIGATAPPSLQGGTFITDRAHANLIWDAGKKQILNARGDVLASGIEGSSLQSAVDARRLFDFLGKVAVAAGGLEVKVASADAPLGTSDDRVYKSGEEVRFEVEPGPFKFLTAFDLNSHGEVQFLYPMGKDSLQVESTTPFGTKVGTPFGGDYAVFIRSDEPLADLHAAFAAARNWEMTSSQAYEAIRRALRGIHVRVGIRGLYTAAR
jgi:uncharacterized caspase-like protein